jgi:RimJ/RimL family protein N-acetyltransferase
MFEYVDKDRQRLEKFLPWPPFIKSPKDELKFINLMDVAWKDFKNFDFSIFRKEDGVYLGNIGVHSISWKNHWCEIGYWILGRFEGQGYMSEAVRSLEVELFKLGFNRVQIRCSTLNSRSANVPKACGYVHEGTMRKDGIDQGKFRDTHVFSKLQGDWKNEKARSKTQRFKLAP